MEIRRIALVVAALALVACNGASTPSQPPTDQHPRNTVFDETHEGVRLVLHYNGINEGFFGTLLNTTAATTDGISVAVQLSNGIEIKPTRPKRLEPGEIDILYMHVQPSVQDFDTYSVRVSVGS